ncbi:glycoside hydrolase family 76 protein [Zalerion maritima]|uniref:Mannan endo-1,6-alpha-mannosidase n=1 Tax=Zalerion maritima TaxID=339359 RepID=A0AAD5RSY3_9PEZI|nr:glycoside hydrolase family 76 protein [Zalerion maritima]
MKITHSALVAASFVAAITSPGELDSTSRTSIKNVASTLAYGTMSYYTGNVTNTPETIATLPDPYYWWEAGAMWGAMLDYCHYTGDESYVDTVTEALLSQVGPDLNYMNPVHYGSTGNDDQAFWGFAVLSAAERNLPQPQTDMPSWLTLSENLWNSMVSRWNVTHCGGGFTWQIFAENPNGMNYKNSVSNGGFFQLSARLARATGNETYTDWATKVWDWSEAVGLVSSSGHVFDGTDSSDNCTDINHLTFSYSQGIYMYGAAVMANYTQDTEWSDRAALMLDAAENRFFSPYDNATDIMFEQACETVGTCNVDMKSFKGYLARFMWSTTKMLPALTDRINSVLTVSATAAAQACTGGDNGTVCGQKWYVGGFDGETGLGQQMGALEIIQGLLVQEADAPYASSEIEDVRPSAAAAPVTPSPAPSKRSGIADEDGEEDAALSLRVNTVMVTLFVGLALIALGL